MKSAPAIAFDYRPSRALQAALIAVGILAIPALLASGIPAWGKLACAVAVPAYAGLALRRLRTCPVRRCAWQESGDWRIRDAAGREHAARLVRSSVRAGLIVLTLRSPPRRALALVLLPDNCDAQTRRRLRVRLARVGAGGAGA